MTRTTYPTVAPGAWSLRTPSGLVFTRDTHAEAMKVATTLAGALRVAGITSKCQVYKTGGDHP